MSAFENPKKNDQAQRNITIQPQLEVGRKDDEYEQEADAMANKVMRMSDGPEAQAMHDDDEDKIMKMSDGPEVQPMHDDDEDKIMKMSDGPELQPKHDGTHTIRKMDSGGGKGMTAPASVEAGINSSKGSGQSLPADIQREMESKMGADLSDVKVHTDGNSAEMNNDINAKAFTHGQDIYFNQGQYHPSTSQGKHLLAHELTHTVQQGKGVQRKVMRQEVKKIEKDLPEKITSLVKNIYEMKFIHYPEHMNDNLMNWITNMNFPEDEVSKDLATRITDAFNSNIIDLTLDTVIDFIPNEKIQTALKFVKDVSKEVIEGAKEEKRDLSNLRSFWNSQARTYNHLSINAIGKKPQLDENLINTKTEIEKQSYNEQKKAHDALKALSKQVTSWFTNVTDVNNSTIFFSSLYINQSKIKPPSSSMHNNNFGNNAFLILTYGGNQSDGLIGEKDGHYKFFHTGSKNKVTQAGYRFVPPTEILSTYYDMSMSDKKDIFVAMYVAGFGNNPSATLYTPLAGKLSNALFAYESTIDMDRLNVRKRLQLESYGASMDYDVNGKPMMSDYGGNWTGNYGIFFYKILWDFLKFPSVSKDRFYTSQS